jgi:hypothetical protein
MTFLRMKSLRSAAIVSALVLSSGCKNFLDVNTNPNAPQAVSANLYLSPMLHWFVTSPIYDGRFVGRYTQQWTLPGASLSTWDRMGYDPSSDNAAQQWRDVYWTLGQNLVDMNAKAEAEQRWDLLGVGYILKAWGDRPARRDHRQGSDRCVALQLRLRLAGLCVSGDPAPARARDHEPEAHGRRG